MPYVKQDRRAGFPENTGELTYKLVRNCVQFYKVYGNTFDTYSKCIAALECAKLEFYRRMLAPHEDIKCKENGDVF
jgi:hypothetical protein